MFGTMANAPGTHLKMGGGAPTARPRVFLACHANGEFGWSCGEGNPVKTLPLRAAGGV